MADADTAAAPDLSQLLAPWMASNPWDPSNYGGQGQMGAAMLAAAGPTPYKQPFLVGLAKGMQMGQQQGLQNASARMGLAGNAMGIQQQMATFPLIMRAIQQRLARQGAPQNAPGPDVTGLAPGQNGVASTVAGASPAAPAGAPGPLTGPPGNAVSQYGAPAGAGAPSPQGQPSAPWMGAQPSVSDRSAGELDDADMAGTLALAKGNPQGILDAAKLRLQYDPVAITQQKLAGEQLTLDDAQVAAAEQARDPQAYMRAYIKRATDAGQLHTASMSGAVTGFGLPPWVTQAMTNYNPSTGKLTANGQQNLIPGAAATEEALEGARAAGEARGKLSVETGPAGGGAGTGGGTSPGRASTPTPAALTGHAALTTDGYVPPILASPGKGATAPGNTSYEALQAMQGSQGKDAAKLAETLSEKGADAQQLITQIEELKNASRDFTPGQYAAWRTKALQNLQSLGALTPDQAKELGSAQMGTKISIQLQAMVTKQLGSREAAQVFSTMGQSVPSLTLSPDGLAKISAYLEGIGRYNMAQGVFAQRLNAQGNAAGVNSLQATFQTSTNPAFYILASADPKTRQELFAAIPKAKQALLAKQWDQAVKNGLAPRPQDYEGE